MHRPSPTFSFFLYLIEERRSICTLDAPPLHRNFIDAICSGTSHSVLPLFNSFDDIYHFCELLHGSGRRNVFNSPIPVRRGHWDSDFQTAIIRKFGHVICSALSNPVAQSPRQSFSIHLLFLGQSLKRDSFHTYVALNSAFT